MCSTQGDFHYKSLNHWATLWSNRALFIMPQFQCEVSICCPLLDINLKCTLANDHSGATHPLLILLFNCQKAFSHVSTSEVCAWRPVGTQSHRPQTSRRAPRRGAGPSHPCAYIHRSNGPRSCRSWGAWGSLKIREEGGGGGIPH